MKLVSQELPRSGLVPPFRNAFNGTVLTTYKSTQIIYRAFRRRPHVEAEVRNSRIVTSGNSHSSGHVTREHSLSVAAEAGLAGH